MKNKLAILFCFLLISCTGKDLKSVCLKGICVKAEIADTDIKRERGLMFRDSLAENQAMLFIFATDDKHSFWMKNMKIPLDIIWISQDKKIVDIRANAKPCNGACGSLIPQGKARYALEVNAGFTDRSQIKIGQEVNF